MSARVYGCNNLQRPTVKTSHVGQAGWSGIFRDGLGNPCRTPIYVEIKHVMSTDCKYDKAGTDAGCVGCKHANGESA